MNTLPSENLLTMRIFGLQDHKFSTHRKPLLDNVPVMRNPYQFSKTHFSPVRDGSDCLDEFFTPRGRFRVIDIHAREGKSENVVFNLCGQEANTVPRLS